MGTFDGGVKGTEEGGLRRRLGMIEEQDGLDGGLQRLKDRLGWTDGLQRLMGFND